MTKNRRHSPSRTASHPQHRRRQLRFQSLENRRVLATLGIDIEFRNAEGAEITDSVLHSDPVTVQVKVQDIRGSGQGDASGVIALPLEYSWDPDELSSPTPPTTLVPLPGTNGLVTPNFPLQRSATVSPNANADPFVLNVQGGAIPSLTPPAGQAIGVNESEIFSTIELQTTAVANQATFTVALDGALSFADASILDAVTGIDRTASVPGAVNTVQASINVIDSSISGMKFDDLNGDGVKGAGEPGIAGVTIRLESSINTFAPIEIQTDVDGNYRFQNLPSATYTITEMTPAGTAITLPASEQYIATLNPTNPVVENLDFGNFELVAISGTKFTDAPNGNPGIRDPGEDGPAGVTIQLDLDSDGTIDATTLTDANGDYQFTGIGPGNHQISEIVPAGSVQTFPVGGVHDIVAVSGQDIAERDFGNAALTSDVSGTKFDDLNGNGVRDAGEPGVAGITIVLDRLNDNLPVVTTTTDADGNFQFQNVAAGMYAVSEVLPAQTVQTTPIDVFTIDVVPPNAISGLEFGNFRLTSLSGIKFEDIDGDGIQDPGELPIEGVTINLDILEDGTIDAVDVTDAEGRYEFVDVGPGNHLISEIVPSGFTPTTLNPVTVANRSGENRDDLHFGNRELPPTEGSISGFVYSDNDFDGVFDANEFGLPGVTVQLFDDASNTRETITGPDGSYRFADLPAGTYRIVESQPDRFGNASITRGQVLPGGEARGQTSGQNTFENVVLAENEIAIDYNFGEVLTSVTKRMFTASANLRGELSANISPTEFRINGTSGDDRITIENLEDDGFRITINQSTPVTLTSEQASLILIDGLGGVDRVDYLGSEQSEMLQTSPSAFSAMTTLQSIGVFGVEDIRVDGGGGNDRAVIRDSSGSDQLNARDNTIALFTGDGQQIGLTNIANVQAVSAVDSNEDTTAIDAIDFALELVGDWQS